MKYKEKVITLTKYGYTFELKIPYLFRFDPVPGIKKCKGIRPYYRHPKTTQERRWSIAHKEYVRLKRRSLHLPETWDDICYARREKGWKRTKKKKQWM